MPAAPDFLQYAPADILKMGQERGLPPEQIAQAVTRHRDNIAAYAQQQSLEPDRFHSAMTRLYNETNAALKENLPSFRVGDTLSGIGEAFGGLTETFPAALQGMKEGITRPDQSPKNARDAFASEAVYKLRMQQEQQQRLESGQGSTAGDLAREAGQDLGFTGGSMAAAIPAGILGAETGGALGAGIGSAVPGLGTAAGGTVGALVGGASASMTAAGTAAYRMAGNQFMRDAFDALQKQHGDKFDEPMRQQAFNELAPIAENYALWEAGPEAIGTAAMMGAGKVVLGIGKPFLQKLATTAARKAGIKLAALGSGQATELATEWATAMGQGRHQAQSAAYAARQPEWQTAASPYAQPGGAMQALKDVAPQTLTLGALTLGAGGAATLATKAAAYPFRTPEQNAPLPPNQAATPSATAPNASPAAQVGATPAQAVSTLSRIAAESVAPEEDTGAFSAQDLETRRLRDLESSNQAGVGQAISDVSGSPPLPLSPSPSLSPTASVTKDSGVTADNTAQNTPGAGLSPAAGAFPEGGQAMSQTGQPVSQERIISTGKPNGAQVSAVIDYVEAADLEPLLLREVGDDQTRDRANNRASAEQIAAIATSPDAQLLGDSPVSLIGAPVVDDKILAGNGRAEGLIQGYRGGGAGIANYRAQIVQQAAAQGRPDVAAMKQPVMIRRVTNYVRGDRRQFVTESNPKYAVLQETVAEAAMLDAEVLGDMAGIEFTQSGQLTSSSLQQVATKLKAAQRGVNATTGGKPDVVEGTRRVQLASLARLARDNGVDVAELSGLLETDVGRRAVAEVSKAAPRLAALDADLGLGDVMLSALRSFSEGARAVSQGIFKNLTEWADNRGQELIRDELSPEAGQLLEIMIETVRTPTKLRELFDTYLEDASNEQDQRNQSAGTNDIFGDARTNVTGKAILRRQLARTTDTAPATSQESRGQGDAAVAADSPSLPISPSPSLDSLLAGTESTRPRNVGETARAQNADPLGELMGAKQAGEAEQAQGKMGFTNLNTNGSTAGFANTEILAEAADLIRQGITDFANWSKAMLTRFGRGIQEFLAGIWQQVTNPQTNAAQNVRMGRAQGTAPVTLGASGAVLNPAEGPQMRENRSRMALSEEDQRMYEVQGNAVMLEQAEQWLAGVDNETAVRQIESGLPPDGLRSDHLPALSERTLQRLVQATTGTNEIERMKSEALLDRASTAHQDVINREKGRGLQQVGAANDRLAAIMPIMGAKKVLIDRADAVVKKRFTGGADGVKTKIEKILADADLDISERVERILATVMQAALKPVTSIKDAVAALMPGKSQREQMIEDVAQALMIKARGNVVTPERKTALAALAASLKQTLGASVQGDAKKAATSPLGEVLARAFVDQVSESKLFTEAWDAGRQSVFDMFYDMELDKAFHPARMRAEQAQARLTQLEAGNNDQRAASAAERAELKLTLKGLKAKMQAAKDKADGMTNAFWQQVGKLMPATPTMAYAPGMSKEAIKRGFEAAGYTAEVKTGMKQDGTRTLNVQDALRDPKRAMQAVLNVWDAEAQAAGIDPAAWQEGRKLAWQALNETLTEWQTKATERAAKLAQAQKDALMAKDSPALVKLLKHLAGKIAPGMDWTEIFTDLQGTQKARQLAIYDRLMKDERLQGLTQDERIALTNELDKAWMRERRTVFNRELQKAGILGEKKASDRLKVKNAAPRLLRLMNLGMFNSEMFREVIAKEYGLKMIDAKAAAELRAMSEEIQKAPEGLPRRKKEQQLMDRLQSLAGSTMWQVLDSWWTASVLSGWRTQVDIGFGIANGIEDVGLGSIVTALRTGNKDVALRGLGNLLARIPSAFMEAVDHVGTGNKAMMRNFELEVKQAMEGGNRMASDVGAQMWRDGGWRKVPGGFMIFYGRLLTALDHINSASTREGAKAMAMARHPELYQRALRTTAADKQAARQQARLEMTGGAEPTTQQERLEETARMREILEQGIPTEVLAEATEIGRAAALQGEPTGLGGALLDMVTTAVGIVARKAEAIGKRPGLDAKSQQVLKLLQGTAPLARAITGTKFARTLAHSLNRTLSYVPGVGAYAVGQQGRTGAFGDILAAKQVIGTLVGIALYLAFDDDDDERGIEDGWKDKTPQEKAQLYAQGKQPFTVWERDDKGRVRSYNYQQWGIAGIVNTVGAMLKQKDSEAGAVTVLMSSLVQGTMSFTDKAQLQGLQTIISERSRSTDPVSGIAGNLNKWAAQTVGGMIPRLAKDIDMVASPELRNSSVWWQKWAKEVPMLRQLSSGKRIDILGGDVLLDRGPLSRVTQLGTADPTYRMLGRLNEKDVWLPDPSQGVRVVKLNDGTRRDMTAAEKDRYQRLTGAAYRQYLNDEGAALLQMPPADAQDKVSNATKNLRNIAARQATH